MDTQTQLATITHPISQKLSGRNVSERSSTAYRTELLQFLTWLSENDVSIDNLEKITRTHILDYFSHLADEGRSGVPPMPKLAATKEAAINALSATRANASFDNHMVEALPVDAIGD